MILATHEAEIRRITVQGQPGKNKSLQGPTSTGKKQSVVVHAYHASYGGKHKIGGL
jgi:hypothetical protein